MIETQCDNYLIERVQGTAVKDCKTDTSPMLGRENYTKEAEEFIHSFCKDECFLEWRI